MTSPCIAIVGAGPAGFYAAEALLKAGDPALRIHLFDKLPTPFGLLRSGVAPDHQNIKRIARSFARTAGHPRVSFWGNVALGRDLSVEDLRDHHDAILYATGSESFLMLALPGASSPGVRSATEVVFWYNGHPEHQQRGLDLLADVEQVVIVGVGNVAVDVARILLHAPEALEQTDIAPAALAVLRRSRVRQVTLLGRRGALQAAFSPHELHELASLPHIDLQIDPADALPDPVSEAWAASADAPATTPKLQALLADLAARPPRPQATRRLVLRFCTSPRAFLLREDGALCGVEVVKNRLILAEDGRPRPVPTDQVEVLQAQLALTSIGYRGLPLPGVPFEEGSGTIPSTHGGRVLGRTGEYVVGWARRGPTGLIGANRPDAREVVDHLLEDLPALPAPRHPPEHLHALLQARGVRVVSWEDWQRLDAEEQRRGQLRGSIREKLTDCDEMIRFLS